jgi:hypothetical protein
MADASSTGSEGECCAEAGIAAESAARSRVETFEIIKCKGRNCSLRLSLLSKLIQRRPIAAIAEVRIRRPKVVRRESGGFVRGSYFGQAGGADHSVGKPLLGRLGYEEPKATGEVT